MSSTKVIKSKKLILAMVLCSIFNVASADKNNAILSPKKAFNLDFGNSLFYLYQEKYFSALTQLKIAKTISPIKTQGFAPDIIYSGLALEYGINSLASKQLLVLSEIYLNNNEHDQIWLYQARLNLYNHQDSLAETALAKIGTNLPPESLQEKNNLLVEIYIRLNKLDDAQQLINKLDSDNDVYFYSRYNLGVAYIRAGKIELGTKMLSDLGELDTERNDLLALKDKVNIALGFSYLRENKPEQSTKYFTKIRLNGPFSNKGLLGLGWSYVLSDKHKKALTPWVELKSRHTIEPSVQEVLLAIPNSLEKLSQFKAAAGQYEEAIASYKKEVKKLTNTLRLIKSGEFIESLKPSSINEDSDYPWHLTSIPETDSAVYLGQLFGSHDFQVGFKNYRTLLYLNFVLDSWKEKIPSYKKILNIRKNLYDQRLTQIDLHTRISKFNKLDNKYKKLVSKLNVIEKDQNDLALADSLENKLFNRMNNVEQKLTNGFSGTESTPLLDSINRLRSILIWDIKRDYIPRLWSAKQALLSIQESLDSTTYKKDTVKNSMSTALVDFSEYKSRFSIAQKRLNATSIKLKNSLDYQKRQLSALATTELSRRQLLLQGYIDQAQYSLARLFDKLSTQ